MVDPEEIPTFGRRRRSQRAEDRDTPLRQAVGNRGLLSAAELLPHPEDDGPAIRHEDRIVDEDRVGTSLLRLLVVPDLGTRGPQHLDQRGVLCTRGDQVRSSRVSPDLRRSRRHEPPAAPRGTRPRHPRTATSRPARRALYARRPSPVVPCIPRSTKIASARASCGSSWYQTSAPEDRNISTSAACSVRAATKSGRPVYPQIFGSAWAKASSGRRTRTVRRGSTMLWLPYEAPTLTSSREALAALSSSPKSSSIFGAARSGQDSSSAPDVDPGDGPLDRLPDHPQRWKEDPRPRPRRVAGGRRQGDSECRRLRPRVRLPTDRHRENVRERTGRRDGGSRERHSPRRDL